MTVISDTGPIKLRKVAKMAAGTIASIQPANGPVNVLIQGAKTAAMKGATAISATMTSRLGPKRAPETIGVFPNPLTGISLADSNVPQRKLNQNRTGERSVDPISYDHHMGTSRL